MIYTRRFLLLFFISDLFLSLSATTHIIKIQHSAFVPSNMEAYVGDTVQWIWQAGKHTIQSVSTPKGVTPWKASLNSKSKTFQLVLSAPGTYDYLSTAGHARVKGQLNVNSIPLPLQADVDTSIKIYPQPFKRSLTIDLNNAKIFKGPVDIEIFDALGQSKYQKSSEDILLNPLILNLPDWPAGYYFVNLSDKSNKRTYRIIKAER